MNFINVCQYTDTKVILRIHITIQKPEVSKNSNIVKCYYNLKCLKYLNEPFCLFQIKYYILIHFYI